MITNGCQNKLNGTSQLVISGTKVHRIAMMALLLVFSFATQSVLAEQAAPSAEQEASPPERAHQEAAEFKGFSSWDIQALYGSAFREPGVSGDVAKGTLTLENSSAWSWGSSYFFVDVLRSNSADQNATEIYGEWYPSASISRISGHDFSLRPVLKDILITMGVNAGRKNTGASPLVFLPGLTFDLKIPAFQFFSLGLYAYVDRGQMNGHDNGSNTTTYQITPSWSLPFALGCAKFRFDGFVDFIGHHGQSVFQVVAQPTIKLDLGNFKGKPNKLFAGVEWAYWRNKYGISGFNQTGTQLVLMWVL